MSYSDPYHQIGLHRNPFIAPENLEISSKRWLDFGFSQPPPIRKRLFWQVLGQKGAGKTSHLLHWKRQTDGSYHYCHPGWKCWQWPPVAPITYWDEANRIPLIILLICLCRAYWTNSTIVVSTHKDLSLFAHLFGLEVKTINLSTLCVSNLIRWVQQSIEAERISPSTPIPLELTTEQAELIVAKSKGSWRMAANYLHIWVAEVANTSLCNKM